jgi:hypothetical protein
VTKSSGPARTLETSELPEPIQIDPKILEPLRQGRLANKPILFINVVADDGEEQIFFPKGVRMDLLDARTTTPKVELLQVVSEARLLVKENPCCVYISGGDLVKVWRRRACRIDETQTTDTQPQCR